MKTTMMRALAVLVSLLLSATMMWSQGTTSRITGVVTDPTGAVVAGATVKATNQGTNQTYTTTTSAAGVYSFESLQIGTYTISVEGSGFKQYVSKGNVLSIGVPTAVNVSLQLGTANETVEVQGGYDIVQTETSGNFGEVVDNQTLTQLPVVGVRSRSPLSLVQLIPGVVYNGANATGGGISVHGSRDRAWNYTLDGIDVNESTSGGSNTTPTQTNPDSISEFRVLTGNFTPEYGRSSGGQVTMVTKSGGNDFHGTAYWFYQSPFLMANTPQNKTAVPPKGKSQFVQNIPGFSVGGPIQKNKTFFFTNVQFLHARNSNLVTRMVPTESLRSGIFRYVPNGRNTPYGSSNASVDANGNPVVAVNSYDIAANDPAKIGLDSAIQSYMKLVPAPNTFTVGDGLNTAGYAFVAPQLEKQANVTVKIDHTFSDKSSAYFRWYSGHQNTIADTVNGGQPAFPGLPQFVDTHRIPRNFALNWRYNPTSHTTNEFVIGMNRFGYEFVNPDPQQASNPPFQFNGSNTLGLQTPLSAYVNNNRYATTYQIVDNFSIARGAHTFGFGFNGRYLREIDHRGSIGVLNAYPLVYFGTGDNPVGSAYNLPTTAANGINSNDLTSAQEAVNLMLGRIGQVQEGFVANRDLQTFKPARSWNFMDHRWPEYDFYGQDSWKILSNLTLDYGVRWEIRIAPHLSNFPNLVPNQSVLFGETPSDNLQFVKGDLYHSDWNNLGPSVGLAWDPFKDGKTSVRAHYRLSYDRINPFSFSSTVFQGMPGLTYQVVDTAQGQDSTSGGVFVAGHRAANWVQPAPPAGLTPAALTQLPAYGTGSLTVADPNIRSPKVHEWGLSIQREIAKDTVVSLSYVGNKGVGLYGGYDANAVDYRNNGFLQAFVDAQNGTSDALMTQLISADPRHSSGQTAVQFLNKYYPSFMQQNNVAGLANAFATRMVSGVPLNVAAGLSPYLFKPYPQVLGGMFVLDTHDYSNYNGLEAEISRRFSNGLLFQGSWTWSKTNDLRSFDPTFTTVATGASQSAAATPFDIHNPRLNYGPADFDRTHVLQGNWVYDLPFGHGQRFGGSAGRLMDALIGGWEFAGDAIYQTGRPITFYSGANTLSSDVQTPASCIMNNGKPCDPYMGSLFFNQTVGQQYYFNMAAVPTSFTPAAPCRAFADGSGSLCIPGPGQASNIGRNYFRQGIYATIDATIAKSFRITERQSLQARLEIQNLTNSEMYDTFGSQSIQSSVFTRLNQAYDGVMNNGPRRMQLALKYTF
ncbi:MAG TPA: TonB-dependent receptor [Terriglobales bacterium]|nr:TonB-dependent receptor [Terriglobales bacterium]